VAVARSIPLTHSKGKTNNKNEPARLQNVYLITGLKTATRAKSSATTWRNNVDRSPQEGLVVAAVSTHRMIII